jgi:glucan phosphoethanolaminetransferase (alkaline phosphatase superfamily)
MDERLWYYAMNQQQYGPVAESGILRLINSRSIGPQTYVWTDGFIDWQQASQVSQFAPLFQNSQLRPASVTVFGILNIIFSSLGIICSPINIVMTFSSPYSQEMTELVRIWLIFIMAIGLFMDLFLLALGIGLLRLKKWARVWSIIYGWFDIFLVIVVIIINVILLTSGYYGYTSEQTTGALAFSCGALIGGLAYPILLIVFMMRKPAKDSCVK